MVAILAFAGRKPTELRRTGYVSPDGPALQAVSHNSSIVNNFLMNQIV
jgi:hypothetical protein